MSKSKKPLEPFRAAGVARVRRPGEEPPKPLPSDIAGEIEGETLKIQVRFDARGIDAVNAHAERLNRLSGVVVTTSDAVRSLVLRGARAFQDDETLGAPPFGKPTNEDK